MSDKESGLRPPASGPSRDAVGPVLIWSVCLFFFNSRQIMLGSPNLSGVFVCFRGECRQTNQEDRLRRTVNYLIRRIVSLSKSKKLDQGLSLFERSQAAEP